MVNLRSIFNTVTKRYQRQLTNSVYNRAALKMSAQLDKIINAYRILSKIPSVTSGRLNASGKKVSATWSVRNLDKGKNTKYVSTYTIDSNLNVIDESDYGTDVSNELLSCVSPRETFKALIREEKFGKSEKKQYLEVWNKKTMTTSIDLTMLDIHGDVYADAEFGCLDWSPDETSIVYVAEKKQQKCEPFIKRKANDIPLVDSSAEPVPKKGEEYAYRQDWGEQLVGKVMSVIVVCNLQTETIRILDGLPESWCPGQVRFTPEGNSVVGVAWETEPRRLGLIFCSNRPSWIFNLTLDGNMNKLSGEFSAVRSPRYSPIGDLVWLQRQEGGPHHACHKLVIRKKDSKQVASVIDIVLNSIDLGNGENFYGLYCMALPKKCFSTDGKRIILSTQQKNEVRSYVVNIDDGKIVDISNKNRPGSTSVLDVQSDIILASCSNLTTPAQLYIAKLPPTGGEGTINWVQISHPNELPPSIASSTVEYLDFEHSDTEIPIKSFNAIYFAPNTKHENQKTKDQSLPLIVWPHGGPHSNFVNAYSLEAAFFNMLGFASMQINYRGSTGVGDAFVYSLLKYPGDYDVKDCKFATDEVVKTHPIDGRNLCLFGGSHGGFLVTHLSGQYPDTYSVVVTRNPVTDIAAMFNYTDIADWCAVEAGYAFTEVGQLSEEQLLAMRRCSPIAHVHKVRAPTALMLGTADKRVPYYQGLEYARRLKANGVTTRVYMYDDNHSLSSPPAEMDNLINSAQWFMIHLKI